MPSAVTSSVVTPFPGVTSGTDHGFFKCAQFRVLVKRILRKYGNPADKQEKATQTVLEQAEALSAEWAVV